MCNTTYILHLLLFVLLFVVVNICDGILLYNNNDRDVDKSDGGNWLLSAAQAVRKGLN